DVPVRVEDPGGDRPAARRPAPHAGARGGGQRRALRALNPRPRANLGRETPSCGAFAPQNGWWWRSGASNRMMRGVRSPEWVVVAVWGAKPRHMGRLLPRMGGGGGLGRQTA